MNSLDRLQLVLKGEIPDMVPILEIVVEKKIIQKIMPGKSLLDFYENIDLDGIVIFEDIPWIEINSHIKKDHFGVLRDFGNLEGHEWPLPVSPLIDNSRDPFDLLDKLIFPDPHDPSRLASLRAAINRFKGRKAVIFGMHSSFLYPSLIRGFENLLMDYIVNPDFAAKLTQKVVNYFLELEKHAIEYGADAIIDCEDYCSNKGLFISPDHFQKFILPGLKQAVNIAKDRGIPFMKHSDGYVWPILNIFVDLGIDSYNPVDFVAGMDIAQVKKVYGNILTIHGNIDSSYLMVYGNPEDVKEAVRQCIKVASPNGRHILSSSSGIHSLVRPENFLSMINAAREFGRYPIKV